MKTTKRTIRIEYAAKQMDFNQHLNIIIRINITLNYIMALQSSSRTYHFQFVFLTFSCHHAAIEYVHCDEPYSEALLHCRRDGEKLHTRFH